MRKPTIPRTSAMAVDASTTPMLRSSAVSAALGGAIATWAAGIRRAARVAARYTTTATPRMPCDPASAYAGAARRPAPGAARPESSCSFELASTSSSSLCTTVGTRALRATPYALPSASTANASGNSSRLLRSSSITRQTTARTPLTATTIQRRPPWDRSRAGPMNGATKARGATVRSR